MSLSEKFRKQAKEGEEKKEKKKIITKKEEVSKKKIKKISKKESSITNPTLDTLRGIYFFMTGIGDKTMSKNQITLKIKQLLSPNTFGIFLENLSKYLQSI